MFFKYEETDTDVKNSTATPDFTFEITYVYTLLDIGRIHTEKAYRLDQTNFYFFVSTPSPPLVYQFAINHNNNINLERVYDANSRERQRYVGNDQISVNSDYIALVLFDNFDLTQVIRVFYRRETNFGVGHTHISLKNFTTSISAMTFLGYEF